jgi:arylsulfatase A
VGKWQLSGDLKAPYHFGFGEYCLWQIQAREQRYWQPRIIENEKLRTDVADRYGPDVFCDYINDFIKRKKDQPFFLYFPMCLTHSPFCPTPESPGPKNEKRTTPAFFADMVHYMDNIIGRIVATLDQLKLRENTLILFTGDNGTGRGIQSRLGKKIIKGGKGQMTDAGTRVPLIAHWKGTTPVGKECHDLIDFSDFMPTLAEMAKAPLPNDRVIDGRSFLPQLRGEKGNPREWIFCHYWGNGRQKEKTREFVRNQRWKLYDDGSMFDVLNDPLEQNSQPSEELDSEASKCKKRFRKVFASLK